MLIRLVEWNRIQDPLIKLLLRCEESIAQKALSQRQAVRSQSMQVYYVDWKDTRLEDFEEAGIKLLPFPTSSEFLQFESVKPIWKLDGVDMDEAFEEAEEAIDKELLAYRNKIKTNAVKQILSVAKLDLPLEDYDDDFFELFTSQFTQICPRRSCNHLSYTFEEALGHPVSAHGSTFNYPVVFRKGQKDIALAILAAGGLEEDASIDEVRALDRTGRFLGGKDQESIQKAALRRHNFCSASELVSFISAFRFLQS